VNVVGLSAFFHEATCCLLVGGELVAAASEERFSRVKHDPRLPVEAFRFCLEAGGLGPGELDAVAYYESPVLKLSRQLWAVSAARSATAAGSAGSANTAGSVSPADTASAASGGPAADDRVGRGDLPSLDPEAPERAIRERLGWEGPLLTFEHHLSHAASAYLFSGFPEAAVLTVDGVGEWATTAYGRGAGGRLELFEEVRFPHSLGLFYSTITAYLGFRVNGGEQKVMGLAPYGRPRYAGRLRRVLRNGPGGSFTLDLAYFDFLAGRRMFSDALAELLDGPPRRPGEEILPRHMDVARSAQEVLEEVLLDKVRHLHRRVGGDALCLAGGVALNCVANGRLLREGPFRRLFVQPAAGDAGGALGAAALAHQELAARGLDQLPPVRPLRHAFLGPRWSAGEVAELLAATGLAAADHRGREEALFEDVAARLAAGQVVGWFQGAMELGPRALGARSILASPLDPGMRERLNRHVKRREGFRPFAPAVLADRAAAHFALDHPSPFMLETCAVRSPLALPAVTHVDGSARPQTVDPETAPRLAALLTAFERRTGCPVLLNTSFNVRGEPIVASPADALFCFADAGLDALAIEDFVVDRSALPAGFPELLAAWRTVPESRFAQMGDRGRGGVSELLYTFV
jgi:carbamoyltransferase